jgi:hypothetical protein
MGETWLCIDCKDERVSGPDEICIGCLIAEARRAVPENDDIEELTAAEEVHAAHGA